MYWQQLLPNVDHPTGPSSTFLRIYKISPDCSMKFMSSSCCID